MALRRSETLRVEFKPGKEDGINIIRGWREVQSASAEVTSTTLGYKGGNANQFMVFLRPRTNVDEIRARIGKMEHVKVIKGDFHSHGSVRLGE